MGMVYGYQNKWDHHNDYIWIIVGPMATVLVVRTKILLIKSCGGLFLCNRIRVSVQGVESLWGDCRFVPADWGS